ncbi:MAG: hypothetical protein Hals2KO_30410 [Halioglobus sp.]
MKNRDRIRGAIKPRANIPGPSSARGFSLLEMMVAIAILALALGYLYQASGGATRNLRVQEKYAHGVELARSLLAEYSPVSAGGVDATGSHGEEYTWRVTSTPVESVGARAQQALLHSVEVSVSWSDGLRRRQVALHSVVGVEK